jgi:hypothetical protein
MFVRASSILKKRCKGGYIYLIQESKYVKTNESIYKIGRTKDLNESMSSYSKDCNLLIVWGSHNLNVDKRKVKKFFDNTYKKRNDIGNEYYEGNLREVRLGFMASLS